MCERERECVRRIKSKRERESPKINVVCIVVSLSILPSFLVGLLFSQKAFTKYQEYGSFILSSFAILFRFDLHCVYLIISVK